MELIWSGERQRRQETLRDWWVDGMKTLFETVGTRRFGNVNSVDAPVDM